MNIRQVLVAIASLGAVAALGVASVNQGGAAGQAQSLPLCGGNNDIKSAPVDCTNSKTFTFGNAQRTVTVVLHVGTDGAATATFTLDKTVPVEFKLRVRSHAGVSSNPGPLVDDVSGTFPANSLGPVVLPFRVECGQIDMKAVFVGEGDARGRVGGPYVCVAPVVSPTTVAATTIPGTTVPGATTTVAPLVAVNTVAPGVIPATR
jgi:hypothetical protein